MYGYRVCEAHAAEGRVVLHDASGRYHLARIAGDIPPLWEELLGEPPAQGFNLLINLTGGVYRANFESINVGRRGPLGRTTLAAQ